MPVKSKFFRICQSGPTVDGREISPELINQMAETYNPAIYGARVNCEHLLSLMPKDTPFPAFGDVLALKAEDGPDGTRVLLAQVEAQDNLVALNKKRQKVFWSAEIAQNFAKSGKAYLTGLAITDTPASLGTEMIKLTAGAFASQGKLISDGLESPLEYETAETENPANTESLLAKLSSLLDRAPKNEPATPSVPDPAAADRLSKLEEGMALIAKSVETVETAITKLSKGADDAPKYVTQESFQDLLAKLSAEPAGAAPPAPHAGQGGGQKTDC